MKKTLLIIALFIGVSNVNAQQILNVKYSLEQSEYGGWFLFITPNTFDATKVKTTKLSGVYAVKICLRVTGKEKQVYQDCTNDFMKKGKKEFFVASGSKKLSDIDIVNVTFFRRDKDRSTWPALNCFKK